MYHYDTMKRLIVLNTTMFLLVFSLAAYAGRSLEERRAELMGFKIPEKSREVQTDDWVSIQSVKRGKVTGWVWKGYSGNEISSIDVKFKINESGKHHLSCVKVYLFDSNDNQITSIDSAFYQALGSQPIYDLTTQPFKGKKTYVLRFPIPSHIKKYKNAVAVIGEEDTVYAKTLKKSSAVASLDFPEVDLVK